MNNEFIKPMNIVFEDDIPPERIAEFINLLSEFYGENLEIISVNDIPPNTKKREVA